MTDKLNGRRINHWSGQDRKSDIDDLVTTIAVVGELYSRGGVIVRLEPPGKLVQLNLARFREFIDQHICGVRLVQHDGIWKKEYFSFTFPPARRFDPSLSGPQPAPDESEPDEKVLDEIYRTELVKRLPKADG